MDNLSVDKSCESLYNAMKECVMNKSYDSQLDDNLGYNEPSLGLRSASGVSVDQDNSYLCDYLKMMACSDDTLITQNTMFTPSSKPTSTTFDCGSILGEDGRISLAYENLKHIPRKIAEKFSSDTRFLDLSYNNFRSLAFLTYFKGLHTLILDRNIAVEESTLPYLPNLKILWINNCGIQNIPKWIFRIQSQCPSIEQLSLMGNPGARTLINGGTYYENKDFQMFVQRTLPNLLYLDGVAIGKCQTEKVERFSNTTNTIAQQNFRDTDKIGKKSSSKNIKSLFRFKKNQNNFMYPTSSSTS